MPLAASSSEMGVHFNSTPSQSLKALLSRSIDYAGLFPPCELPLEPALQNQAQYVRSEGAWMLNGFVLPTAKFSAAAPLFLAIRSAVSPSNLRARCQKRRISFENGLEAVSEAIRGVRSDDKSVSVVQLEIAVPSDCNLSLLGRLQEIAEEFGIRIFCEAAPADAKRTIALLAQNNTTRKSPLGFKLANRRRHSRCVSFVQSNCASTGCGSARSRADQVHRRPAPSG